MKEPERQEQMGINGLIEIIKGNKQSISACVSIDY